MPSPPRPPPSSAAPPAFPHPTSANKIETTCARPRTSSRASRWRTRSRTCMREGKRHARELSASNESAAHLSTSDDALRSISASVSPSPRTRAMGRETERGRPAVRRGRQGASVEIADARVGDRGRPPPRVLGHQRGVGGREQRQCGRGDASAAVHALFRRGWRGGGAD